MYFWLNIDGLSASLAEKKDLTNICCSFCFSSFNKTGNNEPFWQSTLIHVVYQQRSFPRLCYPSSSFMSGISLHIHSAALHQPSRHSVYNQTKLFIVLSFIMANYSLVENRKFVRNYTQKNDSSPKTMMQWFWVKIKSCFIQILNL